MCLTSLHGVSRALGWLQSGSGPRVVEALDIFWRQNIKPHLIILSPLADPLAFSGASRERAGML